MLTKEKLFETLPDCYHDCCLVDLYLDNGNLYFYGIRTMDFGPQGKMTHLDTSNIIVRFDNVTDLQTYIGYYNDEHVYVPYKGPSDFEFDDECEDDHQIFCEIFDLDYEDGYVVFDESMKFKCDDVKVLAHSEDILDFSKYCNKYRGKKTEEEKEVQSEIKKMEKNKNLPVKTQIVWNPKCPYRDITMKKLLKTYNFENSDIWLSECRRDEDDLYITFSLDKTLQSADVKKLYGKYVASQYDSKNRTDKRYLLILTVAFKNCQNIDLYEHVYSGEKDFFEQNDNYTRKDVKLSAFDNSAKTLSVEFSENCKHVTAIFKEYLGFGYIEFDPTKARVMKEFCIEKNVFMKMQKDKEAKMSK